MRRCPLASPAVGERLRRLDDCRHRGADHDSQGLALTVRPAGGPATGAVNESHMVRRPETLPPRGGARARPAAPRGEGGRGEAASTALSFRPSLGVETRHARRRFGLRLSAKRETMPYRERNRVERFFNRIKHCRRVATRYDKLAANYLAFIKLACIRLWLRLYESTS